MITSENDKKTNILTNQQDLPITNFPYSFDNKIIESKNISDLDMIQDSFKLDLNTLTSIMVEKNNYYKKLITKLANQPCSQVEEISKKHYYKFFADLKNSKESVILDENNNEDKYMKPSNIPVFIVEENKNFSFNEAIVNNRKNSGQISSKISEIKKKIEKENSEVRKSRDIIREIDKKELKLKKEQSEIRKTLDEIFSEY